MLTSVLMSAILIFGFGQQPMRREVQQRERAIENAAAQQSGEHAAAAEKAAEKPEQKEEKPVVTHHQITVRGKVLKYRATAGLMPLKDENGTVEAHIFYIAYTLDDVDPGKRPLTFAYNGGPGSASIWVHLGCMGPKRIIMQADGGMPSPPYHLEDNQYTWLDQTDLVFIDPVGTGYSRPAKPELGKKFWSLQGDIASVGNFIRLYLQEYDRWVSPLFLAGESYGTTRSAGLAGYLINHGVAFNGIILISTVLNFETLLPTRGNDLPYILYVPSFAATAWYHKKLPAEMQGKTLAEVVAEAEKWAGTDYVVALQKGDSLTPEERQDVVNKLASFTGLDKGLIDDANLRITGALFEKNLLHSEKKTIGRLDGRFIGVDELGIGTRPEFDPSSVAIRPPFTAMFSNYIKTELKYKSDLEYYALGGGVRGWDFESDNRFADTSEALRSAFAQNPDMKLFVAMGCYDLATPLFAVHYTLNHMNVNPAFKHNISEGYYEAGHMMYIDNKSIEKLRRDVSNFFDSAVATEPEKGGLDAPSAK